MLSEYASIVHILSEKAHWLKTQKMVAGFDGFIDSLQRIVHHKDEHNTPVYFKHIKDFGAYIVAKNESSFSFEIEETNVKLGGNMPIMSNAMSRLGISVQCVGAMGFPNIHPVFKTMPENCRLYSFAEPGVSTCYEFEDGKIMLGQNGGLNTTDWQQIKNIIGLDTLLHMYAESDWFCLLNWGEIDMSTAIWQGLLKDILPNLKNKKNIFIDLSDCSKRSDDAVNEALDIIKSMREYARIVLSLNKNEAHRLYQVLYNEMPSTDFDNIGESIFLKIPVDTLVLHNAKGSYAFDKNKKYEAHSFKIEYPMLSTGAGDNFNAGFCMAQMLGLDINSALICANAVAALYIQTGKSPNIDELINFLSMI